jgi:succinate dehydrogenase/fumarate reductase flavoprotein subunit
MEIFDVDRRAFLKGVLASGAAVAFGSIGLAGCSPQSTKTTTGETDDVTTRTQSAPAGANWLGEPPAITDADCSEIIDTDVLVVGAGCSGWFAACAAAEQNVNVILIEKYEMGAGVRGSALGAVDSRKQKEAGVSINKMDLLNDYARYAGNQNDMDLVRLWVNNSGEAIDWYCDRVDGVRDIQVDLEYNMPSEKLRYNAYPTGHGTIIMRDEMWKDGRNCEATTVEVLSEYFLSFSGAQLMYQTGMERLIQENGVVVGVYASTSNGSYLRINAKNGVIIATGGYANNFDMYAALQGELVKSLTGVVPFPNFNAQGEGIKACLWAGARFDDQKTSMVFDRGIMRPDQEIGHPFDMDFDYFQFATQPFLKVDSTGNRICNESSPYDNLIHAASMRGTRAWYPIWDANWKEDVKRFHTVGCSTLEIREGGNLLDPVNLDGTEANIEMNIEAGKIIKADTIEELAKGLGFDIATFKKTIDAYNSLYDAQEDSQFGKETFRLSELRTPPFYGVKMGGLTLCTLDGIKINTDFQALDDTNKPIEGLYVIGNDSGSYYAHTYPNLGAGSNAGRCATFGRMCGKALATK